MKRSPSGSSHTPRLLGVEAQGASRVARPDVAPVPGSPVVPTFTARRASGDAHAGPGTPLAALVAQLERRAVEAERIQAHAPVSAVLLDVLAELRAVVEPAALSLVAPETPAQLLTADEVASALNVSTKWVYRAAAANRLPFTRRVGRAIRFDPRGLATWLARLR